SCAHCDLAQRGHGVGVPVSRTRGELSVARSSTKAGPAAGSGRGRRTATTAKPPSGSTASARSNGAGRRLVIVESPAKARKIASYLGSDYVVQSSRGHIRDLPRGA